MDEIVVAPGTYFETIDFLGKAIWLHSSNGPDVTTIDAQGTGTVVTCESGEGPGTIFDGFTITGGSIVAGVGGGMYIESSSPTLTNCTFSGNSASNGAGMFNFGDATVTNCTFEGNSAGLAGGGMYSSGDNVTVTSCTFTGNTSKSSGGGMLISGDSVMVTDCTFTANSAGTIGGGMSIGGISVTNCTFEGNSAELSGGGIRTSGFPTLTDCVFCLNLPEDVSGGFVNGGGNIFACVAGACCFNDSCVVVADVGCIAAGGSYQGNNTTCEASNCTDPCPADIDNSGDVGINDFLDLLAAWGPCK